MRLLHFADLHLDTPFRWADREQARKRRRALRETLLRICQVADEQNVDALTCGGDLYEPPRPHASALNEYSSPAGAPSAGSTRRPRHF